MERCEGLLAAVRTSPPGRQMLHLLDEISDTICHATDAANFCGAAHSDRDWRSAAQRAAQQLNAYMAGLNTESVLWSALGSTMAGVRGMSTEQLRAAGWTAEETKVGDSLLHEFRQAGMGFPDSVQSTYRSLVAREQGLAASLMAYEAGERASKRVALQLTAGVARAYNLPVSKAPALFSVGGPGPKEVVDVDGSMQDALLTRLKCSQDRKPVYRALHHLPDSVLGTMVDLANVRQDIAQMVGLPSYMHYRLQGGSLAAAPEAVRAYLQRLGDKARAQADEDVAGLQQAARALGLLRPGERFAAWDRFATQPLSLARVLRERGLPPHGTSFSAKGTLATLFRVIRSLLGVEFREVAAAPGETWARGVTKYVAYNDVRGELGTVFFDLERRPGKYTGSAHFTIRCGKRIAGASYRLPIVALACSFDGPNASLSFGEVKTLFHEVGHALNSVMCDNALQHMFGARGPLDVVELPSHILERLVTDPRVLQELLASSGGTPDAAAQQARALITREHFCQGLAQLQALALPNMDLALHGAAPPASVERLQRGLTDVLNSTLPYEVPSRAYEHLSINHFVTYAGLCYAYPYSDAIADALWRDFLKGDAYNAAAGRTLADCVFRPGGALDAVAAIQQLLPDALLSTHGGYMPRL